MEFPTSLLDQQVVHGDILDLPDRFDGTIGVIVAQPPIDRPYDDHLEWSRRYLSRLHRAGRPNCRLCLHVPIEQQLDGPKPILADLTEAAQQVGWSYRSTILIRQRRRSPSSAVLVLYRDEWTPGEATTSEERRWSCRLWELQAERNGFSVELPRRCLRLFSTRDDIVLDPFVGSGATLVAARALNRVGIGVDVDEQAVWSALDRLQREWQDYQRNWQTQLDEWIDHDHHGRRNLIGEYLDRKSPLDLDAETR